MADYDNNMSGVLFTNDKKQTDKHPDKKGSCEIEGVEYWISGWIKSKNGKQYLSLSFQPKDGGSSGSSKSAGKSSAPAKKKDDGDIPF